MFAGQSWSERVYTLDYPNRGKSGLGKLLLGGHRRALGRELRQVDFDRVLIYETDAAAVGCPLLVFFGPTDPAVFGAHGSGSIELLVGSAPCQFCHDTPQYGICRDNICLNRLTDEHLWEAWLRLRASARDQS